MLGSHALVLLGVPLARVIKRVREARDHRYRLLRRAFHSMADEEDDIDDDKHQRLHSVSIEDGAAAVGASPQDLDLETIGARSDVGAPTRHSGRRSESRYAVAGRRYRRSAWCSRGAERAEQRLLQN